jgi:hypothetical protein
MVGHTNTPLPRLEPCTPQQIEEKKIKALMERKRLEAMRRRQQRLSVGP